MKAILFIVPSDEMGRAEFIRGLATLASRPGMGYEVWYGISPCWSCMYFIRCSLVEKFHSMLCQSHAINYHFCLTHFTGSFCFGQRVTPKTQSYMLRLKVFVALAFAGFSSLLCLFSVLSRREFCLLFYSFIVVDSLL